MRTTLDLDEQLLKQAKKRAIDEGVSLKALVEQALNAYLAPPVPKRAYRLRWRTEGGGVKPGVDLADWSALRDRMDGAGSTE
ncbi:MAG: type II toxin-antitoxin system VapB family antitoxin [Acidobacteria bacterium]|nr:type II toxin-antitoxin system VapB family antitoxin [Acidobacteriota bacterium]